MGFDWSTLGSMPPTRLVGARKLAHHAAQWVTRAARANLIAAPDDSHSSLEWETGHAALLSQPLPVSAPKAGAMNGSKSGPDSAGDLRVGLRIASLELILVRGGTLLDCFPFDGSTDATAGSWIDAALRASGFKSARDIELPYAMVDHPVGRGARYERGAEAPALEELSRWYQAAAEVLGEVRGKLAGLRPGPGPVRCWPHHFDIATLVALDEGHADTARSISIGVSPGDEFYPQPYAYISPWPHLDAQELPDLPPPGHWHTQGFVAAVATGEEILTLGDRGPGLLAFVTGAFETGRARMKA